MQLDLDTTDRQVVLFATAAGARRAISTFRSAGAKVTAVLSGVDPQLAQAPGVRVLAAADVVYDDRLAPTDELARLAPVAELVDVGKTPYHHKISQGQIEQLMVGCALAGQSVVRLKGGDPFLFGRGGEEVLACVRAGVGVRVVPGVTSAIAVPARAGIPVTHRHVSRTCTVISGHVPPDDDELAGLARLKGTIVIMMGMASLTQIVAGLVRAGMAPGTPAAIIQNGFSTTERRVCSTLDGLPELVRRHRLGSPAVVIIGAVVALADSLLAAQNQLESAAPASSSASTGSTLPVGTA